MAPGHALQAANAQRMYDERSSVYDDSWHPRFARHLVELANLRTGDHVLDLACGTGLVSVAACDAVGPSGTVVGVDISTGMLAEARKKQQQQQRNGQNLELYQHSITELQSLEALRHRQFDVITCASALVLLQFPLQAMKEWVHYLKPGGKLIVDVTHPQSQVVGITMERVGIDLNMSVPHHRLNFQHEDDLHILFRNAGLNQIGMHSVSQMTVNGKESLVDYVTSKSSPRVEQRHDRGDSDALFESAIRRPIYASFSQPDHVDRARISFQEHFSRLSNSNGVIEEIDCVFVGIAMKPE